MTTRGKVEVYQAHIFEADEATWPAFAEATGGNYAPGYAVFLPVGSQYLMAEVGKAYLIDVIGRCVDVLTQEQADLLYPTAGE